MRPAHTHLYVKEMGFAASQNLRSLYFSLVVNERITHVGR
jgi:hypothetical protein